jgi:hypothetical protein
VLEQQHAAEMEDAELAHTSVIGQLQGQSSAALEDALDQRAQQHAAEMRDAGLAHAGAIVRLQGQAAAALEGALAQQDQASAALAGVHAQQVQQDAAVVQVAANAHEAGALDHWRSSTRQMENAGHAHADVVGRLHRQAAAALARALTQQGKAAEALAAVLAQQVQQHAKAVQVAAAAHEAGALDHWRSSTRRR